MSYVLTSGFLPSRWSGCPSAPGGTDWLFGDDLTSGPQAVPGGGLARLGQHLKSAGAVWQTIGEVLGIRIPRAQVEAGQLSAVQLAGPYD
ncbi:hypothetical protein [Streptomyces sp. NPDC101150]|uniref:hypothetical protein n=1 Tax=Streptomyces sp. NPDC101150 TaxID=3366114 RepID=UPI0037FA1296